MTRRAPAKPRAASRLGPPNDTIDAAHLVETARSLAVVLPGLARQAEAGGLQLVAQHLAKALQLVERVAVSEMPATGSENR